MWSDRFQITEKMTMSVICFGADSLRISEFPSSALVSNMILLRAISQPSNRDGTSNPHLCSQWIGIYHLIYCSIGRHWWTAGMTFNKHLDNHHGQICPFQSHKLASWSATCNHDSDQDICFATRSSRLRDQLHHQRQPALDSTYRWNLNGTVAHALALWQCQLPWWHGQWLQFRSVGHDC